MSDVVFFISQRPDVKTMGAYVPPAISKVVQQFWIVVGPHLLVSGASAAQLASLASVAALQPASPPARPSAPASYDSRFAARVRPPHAK
jgi:hypothetical protein